MDPAQAEAKFLQNASAVIQQQAVRTTRPQELLAHWIKSSFEVDIDEDELLGKGSFGQVFSGKYAGAVSLQAIILQ